MSEFFLRILMIQNNSALSGFGRSVERSVSTSDRILIFIKKI